MSSIEKFLYLASVEASLMTIVFLRISSMLLTMPVFGERMIPIRIKLALSIFFSMAVFPLVSPKLRMANLNFLPVQEIILSEITVGVFFGIGLRLFIVAIQAAGSIAGQTTSLAQIFGNQGNDPSPAIGNLLTVSAIALLTVVHFDVSAVQFFILTYDLIPPVSFLEPLSVAKIGSDHISYILRLAFSLAIPFLTVSILYNITLGIINRAMPQLMVAFVGAPLIILVSVGLLALCAPSMLEVWLHAMESFMLDPFVHSDV